MMKAARAKLCPPAVVKIVPVVTLACMLAVYFVIPAVEQYFTPEPWQDLKAPCVCAPTEPTFAAIARRVAERLPPATSLPVPPVGPRRRFAIISYFSPPTRDVYRYLSGMAAYSQLVRRLYADRHGYDVIWEDSAARVPGQTAHWGKLVAIAKWLPLYDWVWWLDVDALVTNLSVPLESIVDAYGSDPRTHLLIARDKEFINSGSMILRSSNETLRFLKAVIAAPASSHVYWEQGPINDLLFGDLESPFLVETGWARLVPPSLLNAGPPGWCVKMKRWRRGDFVLPFPGSLCERGAATRFSDSSFAKYAAELLAEWTEGELQACCHFLPAMAPPGVVPPPAGSGLDLLGFGDRR